MASPRTSRAAGLISGAQHRADTLRVPLASLLENPENPRRDMGDLTEMADSMTAIGVLQALLVCRREAFLESRPDLELSEGQYVVLAGHRRLAAAGLAQLADVPVVINDALASAGVSEAISIVENAQRQAITPMEEARAMALMQKRGKSQRDIATALGISPGQVNKRLKLLELPDTLQRRVENGQLAPSVAAFTLKEADTPAMLQRVATLLEEDVGEATDYEINQFVVERAVREAQAERREERGKARLEEMNVECVTDVPYHLRLHAPEEIEAARAENNLVAMVQRWGRDDESGEPPLIYGLKRANPSDDGADAAAEKKRQRRELRQAIDARRSVLPVVLARKIPAGERAVWVARAVTMALHGDAVQQPERALLGKLFGQAFPTDYWTDESSLAAWQHEIGLNDYQMLRANWVAHHEAPLRVPDPQNPYAASVDPDYLAWLEGEEIPMTDIERATFRTRPSATSETAAGETLPLETETGE